jgi:hypothetical protein
MGRHSRKNNRRSADAITRARGEGKANLAKEVLYHGRNKNDWRAAAFLLGRLEPAVQESNVSVSVGFNKTVTYFTHDPSLPPPPETRGKIAFGFSVPPECKTREDIKKFLTFPHDDSLTDEECEPLDCFLPPK